jgi:apolipoprotein N-acyltransferase
MRFLAATGQPLPIASALGYMAGAVSAFHLAYFLRPLSPFILVYLFCLVQLARVQRKRLAFYGGLAVGFLCAAPQLNCFWVLFGPSAIALWFVLAFWIGLFVLLIHLCAKLFGTKWAVVLTPFVWTGLEYFRSELYYLRFSWLNIGYAFSPNLPLPALGLIGMYGVAFLSVAAVSFFSILRALPRTVFVFVAMAAFVLIPGREVEWRHDSTGQNLLVAGMQMEFPSDAEAVRGLDGLLERFPDTQLFVLSEYTFMAPVPDKVKAWCREHQRYLIIGAEDPAPNNFFDTAFVIGPSGEIIFRQAKSVPVQFMKDGLPAKEQHLWESPWGKIGICICYDLSYTRVTDRLVRLGAKAIINPTMDVTDWGRREHELHARVAPMRSAEYQIPIFRTASSGISQLTDRAGRVIASAPFPGQQAVVNGIIALGEPGRLPGDRILAPLCVAITGLVVIGLVGSSLHSRFSRESKS